MINKYIAMGYVGADPDFNEYSSGKCKANFSIGINYGKETTWVEIECWDKIAKNCNSYVKKGSLVFIEGKMKFSSWKSNKGESKSKLFCVCDFMKVINLKAEDIDSEIHNIKQIEEKESMSRDLAQQNSFEDVAW
jgi:single-strand DNA-binding protein